MISVDYADFDLVITRIARGRYLAQVVHSPAGQASAEFRRPFTDTELENFVLRIGRTRTGIRRLESSEMQAAETFGKKLFEAVFQGEVRERLTSCLDQVHHNQIPGLRIKLRLVNVPELANLPWEYLYHTTLRRFIVLSTKTPITRYVDLPRPVMPLSAATPLRLLVMVASPSDYPTLDVDREIAKLRNALRDLESRGLIVMELLKPATLPALEQRLRQHLRLGSVHLFHFIGHGGWDEQAQDGVMLFEDEHRRGHRVSASRLATILHDHESLRLVMLNACEGARTSPTDPFAGVAAALVQQGIPAVVAMQFEITDRAAIQLASVFYASLAVGRSAEAALANARRAIYASGNDVEWGTPVLYLRAPDGRLFDLTVQPHREPEPLPRPPPPPGPENHLPLLVIFFFNLIIAGTLGFIVNSQNASPCVHPFASMLSVGVIILNVIHLAWRTFRPNIGGNTIQVLGLEVSIRALDELHLWKLPNLALWLLAVLSIIAALVLGLSSLSPFRPIEATPVIQSFDVQFPDGSMRSYKPGDVLEITANQQVLVEAITVGQPSTLCAWSAVSGALQPAAGCSTLYSFPPGGEIDSLAVLVQSPCLTRQAFAGLSIIMSPQNSPSI